MARVLQGYEVGEHSRLQLPGIPAKGAHSVHRCSAHELVRLVKNPAAGSATLIQLKPSRLFEDVNHGVRVTADSQRTPGAGQRSQQSHSVAQVAFRRRTGTDRDPV